MSSRTFACEDDPISTSMTAVPAAAPVPHRLFSEKADQDEDDAEDDEEDEDLEDDQPE